MAPCCTLDSLSRLSLSAASSARCADSAHRTHRTLPTALYPAHSTHRTLPSAPCPVQAVEADAVLASLAAWARGQTALRALDEHAAQRGEGAEGAEGGEGALWQAVLRTAPSAQVGGVERGGVDVQLDLVTAGAPSAAALAALEALAASLLAAHPPLARVLHTVATRPPPPDSGSARGGEGRGGAGGRGGGGARATLARLCLPV